MAIKSYIKDGKKCFKVEIKMRDKGGKQLFRSRQGFVSERQAKEAEFEMKIQLHQLKSKEPSLFWPHWLDSCLAIMKPEFRPSTVINFSRSLNKWVTPEWKTKKIDEISRTEIQRLVYEVFPSKFTPHSRKTLLKMIRKIFSMAVNDGIIDRNPCAGVAVKVPEIDQKVLTNSEVQILLSEAKLNNHRFYAIWLVALMTGMRTGELFGLEWTDIDFEGKIITVSKQWTSKNGFTSTKTMRNRVVPISDSLLVFLKELKLQKKMESNFVLPHLKEWERGEQAQITSDFCKVIGITPVKFHDLRATFITNLLSRGVSLARVMSVVGHSQIKTTNGYLRKAGVEVKGITNELGYDVPVTPSNILSFPVLGKA